MLLKSQFLVAWTTKWLLDPFNKSNPGVQNPTCVYLYHHCSWSNYQLSILSCLNHHFFLVNHMKSHEITTFVAEKHALVKPPVRWNPTWRRDRKSAFGIARTACFTGKHHGNSRFVVGLVVSWVVIQWWFNGGSMGIEIGEFIDEKNGGS